jgi:hypothetical protein
MKKTEKKPLTGARRGEGGERREERGEREA